MESLTYEQILSEIDLKYESELLQSVKKFKLNGYLIKYMDYEQAVKIFEGPTIALQLICFKNRLTEKLKTKTEQIQVIETLNRSREWPNEFVFPVKNMAETLDSKLKSSRYELNRWDIVKIIRILFNEMVLYRILYPTSEQYSQAVDSVIKTYPSLVKNDPAILYKLRTKIRTKFGNYRQNLQKSGVIDLKSKTNTQEPRTFHIKTELSVYNV